MRGEREAFLFLVKQTNQQFWSPPYYFLKYQVLIKLIEKIGTLLHIMEMVDRVERLVGNQLFSPIILKQRLT